MVVKLLWLFPFFDTLPSSADHELAPKLEFLLLLPWELGSAAAHVVHLLGASRQANAADAAAAKFI